MLVHCLPDLQIWTILLTVMEMSCRCRCLPKDHRNDLMTFTRESMTKTHQNGDGFGCLSFRRCCSGHGSGPSYIWLSSTSAEFFSYESLGNVFPCAHGRPLDEGGAFGSFVMIRINQYQERGEFFSTMFHPDKVTQIIIVVFSHCQSINRVPAQNKKRKNAPKIGKCRTQWVTEICREQEMRLATSQNTTLASYLETRNRVRALRTVAAV